MPILAYLIASNKIAISQMTMDVFPLYVYFILSSFTDIAFQDHLSSPPICYRVHVANLFSFLCRYVFNSVLWCLLQFPHKIMFGSSLPPVVCVMTHVLYTLFVFACVLIIWVKWWVSYKRQEMLALRENLVSPPIFGGVHIAQCLGFLYRVVFLCFVCLRHVSCVPNVASVSGLFILECAFCFL